MNRRLRTTTFAVVLGWAGQVAAQSTVAITDVSVIDPATVLPPQVGTILVREGRIAAIGPAVEVPSSAQVIDGRGKFVLAGLWDMHAHLAALAPIGRAPEHYVAHGVLHVRDMGGFLEQLAPLREDIRAGRRVGPTMVIAGPTLNSEQPADFHRKVTTAAEARAVVRQLRAKGVDFIKLHRATNREVFDAVADETRQLGMPFAGHVPLGVTWIDGATAGMRTIEHIQTIFENLQPDLKLTHEQFETHARALEGAPGDRIFATLRERGTYFDPTLIGYEWTIAGSRPEAAAARRNAYAVMKRIVAKAARAGVAIVTGTDVLERHGDVLLTELERLVEIGMTPRQAIAAATVISAAAAGQPELGLVTVGAPASFLVLDANPLDDIRHTRRLAAVVLRGRLFAAEALAALKR